MNIVPAIAIFIVATSLSICSAGINFCKILRASGSRPALTNHAVGNDKKTSEENDGWNNLNPDIQRHV